MGKLSANVDTRWVGDRHDNSFLFMRTVANAARALVLHRPHTSIQATPSLVSPWTTKWIATATVFVRVNNVGDTEYDSALGYPGLPRSAMVGVRFNVAR